MIRSTTPATRTHESISTRSSSNKTSKTLTPFEKDTQVYGKAGATIVGGAKALADVAGTAVTFGSKALEKAASAVAPSCSTEPVSSRSRPSSASLPAPASPSSNSAASPGQPCDIADELKEVIDKVEHVLEDFGSGIAEVSKHLASEAVEAYDTVAGVVDSTADAVAKAAHAVSDKVSKATDLVSGVANAVADGLGTLGDDLAGYTLIAIAV